MTTAKPIIVVVHATSKQGSSVVASLLQTGRFRVKAITRRADSIKATQLPAKGAELVEAHASDEAQLRAAFVGAHGVFAMTLSAASSGTAEERAQHELEQGKLQADVAAAAGVQVFVFSTLENVEERTKGKWSIPSFTGKGLVENYIKEAHPDMTAVFLAPGFFYSNFVERFPTRKGENGSLVVAMPFAPDLALPWLDPMATMGVVATAAFLAPEQYRGAFIPVYDEMLTSREMLDTLSKQIGVPVTAEEMPAAIAAHWISMAGYCEEFGYFAPNRDLELMRKMNPNPTAWANFLQSTGYDGTQSMADIRAKLGQ